VSNKIEREEIEREKRSREIKERSNRSKDASETRRIHLGVVNQEEERRRGFGMGNGGSFCLVFEDGAKGRRDRLCKSFDRCGSIKTDDPQLHLGGDGMNLTILTSEREVERGRGREERIERDRGRYQEMSQTEVDEREELMS